MKKLICAALLFTSTFGIAQTKTGLWKKNNANQTSGRTTKSNLPQNNLFDLDLPAMKMALAKSPKRDSKITSDIIIALPNGEGKTENFKVYENPVMDPALAAKYPEIKSYVAVGMENTQARAYFSLSPLGFKAMTYAPDKESIFIEPINSENTLYTVYKRSEHKHEMDEFECSVTESASQSISQTSSTYARGADDAKLRTYRLALSCTGEYAAYFGGSKAATLASMNNTLTRINGVFERDFGVRLVLIANNDTLIYTNPTTDPFSYASNWGSESQSNLTAVIGEANYDIGHLLGAGAVVSGDAGARGSIGADNYKGRAYSCANATNYQGDTFDINCVAHEMGHQLGANHTFTYTTESTIAQLEPGSGSTIMSYAGITTKDVQQNSDAYFHAISIQQVTDLIKTKTFGTITNTGNAVPVVNAGLNFTIPKGTPFMLNGSATDANSTDALTYSWEQMDVGNATASVPTATATTGPLFRSYLPTVSPIRYFPNMNSILAGLTTTAGRDIAVEALPGVARTLNFRLTVRDNRIGGGANNTDDVVLTVDGVAGPFTVDTQNAAVSYVAGTSQAINWTVAGTNANGVNAANVDILLSTDGGQTFPTVLVSGTPNDGSQNVVIPNLPGTTNRIMVKGSNHIFFDVNNANFTITGSATTDTAAPTASTLSASGTTTSNTNLTWTVATDNTGVTGYDVYQNGALKTTTTATSLAVTGLTASTTYSFYVKAKDAAGNISSNSNTVNVTTSAIVTADTTVPTASTLSASGTTTSATNLSWSAATDNIGITGYNVYQNGVLKTTTTTTSLVVSGLSASTTYSFYVKAKDAAGNVSTSSNTANVTTLAAADTTAPTVSTLSASGTTSSSTNLSWTAASDNLGVTGYNVYQNGALKTTTTSTSLTVTGLSSSTTYNFYVAAKDAAGNLSSASNTVNVSTLALVDSTAPTASTLSASGTTTSSTNLSWTAATDNIGVTGYNVYQNGALKTTTTATSLVVSGLSAATTYSFYVKAKDAAGNLSTNSNTVTVTTLSNTVATYCTSTGGTSREYINRVQIGTINNLSGDNKGYGNYTTLSTNLTTGTTSSITITPAWYGSSVNEAYAVWIDYNQDGNFGSNELAFSKSKTKSTTVNGSFFIPNTALSGTTRMRVSMKFNAVPTACEVFVNGEVEDYTVNIVNGATVKYDTATESLDNTKQEVSTLSFKVYPNPVKGETLFFSGLETEASYRIYNLLGQQISGGTIENNAVNVSSVKEGTYIIEVSDGSSTISKKFIRN
ncbi:reprolysin-like metallopeptidase [Flavobacterium enshiense]|uniref:reprolysin-like metallopeptidase n=1 Tax=Flavobacterium enshiense TaxID=1341165 RepID=UPI00345DDECB